MFCTAVACKMVGRTNNVNVNLPEYAFRRLFEFHSVELCLVISSIAEGLQ